MLQKITFGADLIVGFPTETEENFKNSMDLISECQISNVHVFPFSPKRRDAGSKNASSQKRTL